MKCEDFELRINDLLDARRRPDDDVELAQAAENDVELRAILESYTALVDAIDHCARPACPAGFAAAVLSRYQDQLPRESDLEPQPRILALPKRSWYWGAAAAVVCVASLPLLSRFLPTGRIAGVAPRPAMSSPVPVATATIGVADDGSTAQRLRGYASTVRRTGAAIADLALLMPDLPLQSQVSLESPAEEEKSDVVEQVTQGFEPLTDSAVGAIDFLFKVLPARREG